MAHRSRPPLTRRDALCRIGSGFGMMAFASLVARTASAADLVQKGKAVAASGGLHHAAKAKAVIFLFMNGGLSQVKAAPYVHRSLVPQREARFRGDDPTLFDSFTAECEGVCGV